MDSPTAAAPSRAPMLLVDSGLGGLSVVRSIRRLQPQLPLVYLADTGGFPYGDRAAADISARAEQLIASAASLAQPGVAVLACNTLSTLCLQSLRSQFSFPFVGTVPAIKVAARISRTRRFSLLATPNTSDSRYSQALISEFASDCVVDRYGAPSLAAYAERILLGETIAPELLRAQIAPAFHDDARGKTDAVVLGCTHYPLILEALRAVAPWEVTWVDSSDAIARHAVAQISPGGITGDSIAYVTRAGDVARYQDLFASEGFAETRALELAS